MSTPRSRMYQTETNPTDWPTQKQAKQIRPCSISLGFSRLRRKCGAREQQSQLAELCGYPGSVSGATVRGSRPEP